MPIDALTSLSFAVQSSPGVYALLLGSGISRSAGIPTGWEITINLIEKLAALESQSVVSPELWYREKFGAEPDYSALLNEIGKTASERQAILRQYFEPSAEERNSGRKIPTLAHKAIAKLVAKGFIRIIITTNFDRLLEQALEAEGVTSTIISSADAVEGMSPLSHTPCTIIKLHGDYLDTRIKNTAEELSSYDPRFSTLLDRILDEYGLIICGWSGAWDTALVAAIERVRSRRYTTFWTVKEQAMLGAAQRLAQLRSAMLLPIQDADSFFKSFSDRVLAIEQFNLEHPLTTITAIATLKRFLQDSSRRIDLHDLVIGEAQRMKSEVESLPLSADSPTAETIFHRLQQYEAIAERPIKFFSTLAFFSEEKHNGLILEAVKWFISPAWPRTSYTAYINLRLHPCVLVLYAMCLAALKGNKPELLKILFLEIMVRDDEGRPEESAIRRRLPAHVVDHDIAQQFRGYERHFQPMADRYFDVLKPLFPGMFPTENDFTLTFHVLEVLASLSHLDQRLQPGNTHPWAPAGHFLYHQGWGNQSAVDKLRIETERDYANSTIARTGLFASADRFKVVYGQFIEIMTQYRRF